MQNVEVTIGSQYANSPVLLSFINSFNAAFDPVVNINAFLTLLWDVSTAQGYGLDVWGRIVGVSRLLHIATGSYFGLTGASGASGDSFGHASFYGGQAVTSNFAMTDTAYRMVIYAKAFSNICDGTIPSINKLLLMLFPGRGNCYCTDGENMSMTFSFHFVLQPVEAAIVSQTGILPIPPGVAFSIVQGLP